MLTKVVLKNSLMLNRKLSKQHLKMEKKKKNNADFACGLKDNLQDDNMGIKQYNSPCKLK